MSATCPRCGGWVSTTEELCPECLKRVALQEPADCPEAAGSVDDLLPEPAQRKASNTPRTPTSVKGDSWGDYELLEPIGQGAMGKVFKARHVRLNRLVALKLISQGNQASEGQRKRFLREAEAVARLQHPHIVTLYESGEVGGQPYLAMEYVPGKTLAESIAKSPLPPRQAAECLKKVAEAVHYAHEQGVLHRDLKPSNVALDAHLEPRVMDFGLARLVEQDSEMTLTGMAIGSPSYMAPEQAAGRVRDVGVASDVYAIGAILYEALTARPPFQAESAVETMRQVVEQEPVSPRLLTANVPLDLETICLKCLEKQSARRYPTARELADDLGRFLRNEPIQARPLSAAGKLARWCRRKPALTLSLGSVAVLMLIIAIGSPIVLVRINRDRNRAEAARNREAALRVRAESAERQTEQQLYTALLEQARAIVISRELGQRERALAAVRRAAAISNSAALRGAAIAAFALPDLRFERELPIQSEVTLIRLDPTFQRIALCRREGPVEIRDATDQSLLTILPPSTNRPSFGGLWSPDGRFVALTRDLIPSGGAQNLEVWDWAKTNRVLLLHDAAWGAVSFHARLPRLLAGQTSTNAVTWDLESGRELARHQLTAVALALKFAPDGEHFATSYQSGEEWKISVLGTSNGLSCASHVFTNQIRDFNWHPSGRWIAVPDTLGAIYLMDAQTGETQLLGHHKARATVAEFSPDGRYLFSGGWDRELICWDLGAMQRAFRIGLDSYRIQLSDDGKRCAVLRWPEVRLQLHAFELPILGREFHEDLGGQRNAAAFSRDGHWLAASGAGRLIVWDLTRPGPGTIVNEASSMEVGFAPNGDLFAHHYDSYLRWRVRPGIDADSAPQLERVDLPLLPGLDSLCLVTNGVILTAPNGSQLAAYDPLTINHRGWASTAPGPSGVSPDEQWLGVYRAFSPYLEIHRLPRFDHVARLTNQAAIARLEFSPQSDEVAVPSRAGVEFWSTANWQRTRAFTNFTDARYSPDGRTIWLSTGYQTAGLHDARTGQLILPLPNGTLPLAVSPNGRYFSVSVDSRRVQLWDLVEVRRKLRELGLDWPEPRAGRVE